MSRIWALGLALAGILAAGSLVAQDEDAEPGDAAESDAAATGGSDAEDGGDEQVSGEPQPSSIDLFYEGLRAENAAAKVETNYGPQVVYEDPFGRVEGKAALIEHYQKLLANVGAFYVDVKEEFVSGDETVAIWTMTFTHKSLNDGEPVVVDGVTHVRFADGKIVGQKNYFDLGGMVYERTTIVGSIVRWVKGKILN